MQLHTHQEHTDIPLLEHTRELISKLGALGVEPSPMDGGEEDDGDWEDSEGSEDSDGDVVME